MSQASSAQPLHRLLRAHACPWPPSWSASQPLMPLLHCPPRSTACALSQPQRRRRGHGSARAGANGREPSDGGTTLALPPPYSGRARSFRPTGARCPSIPPSPPFSFHRGASSLRQVLRAAWSISRLDIEKTLRHVCDKVRAWPEGPQERVLYAARATRAAARVVSPCRDTCPAGARGPRSWGRGPKGAGAGPAPRGRTLRRGQGQRRPLSGRGGGHAGVAVGHPEEGPVVLFQTLAHARGCARLH